MVGSDSPVGRTCLAVKPDIVYVSMSCWVSVSGAQETRYWSCPLVYLWSCMLVMSKEDSISIGVW